MPRVPSAHSTHSCTSWLSPSRVEAPAAGRQGGQGRQSAGGRGGMQGTGRQQQAPLLGTQAGRQAGQRAAARCARTPDGGAIEPVGQLDIGGRGGALAALALAAVLLLLLLLLLLGLHHLAATLLLLLLLARAAPFSPCGAGARRSHISLPPQPLAQRLSPLPLALRLYLLLFGVRHHRIGSGAVVAGAASQHDLQPKPTAPSPGKGWPPGAETTKTSDAHRLLTNQQQIADPGSTLLHSTANSTCTHTSTPAPIQHPPARPPGHRPE